MTLQLSEKIYCDKGLFVYKKVFKGSAFEVNKTRSAITSFSPGAGKRMRKYLRSCEVDYTAMVTLTYPGFFSSDGARSKNHLRYFIEKLKRDFDTRKSLGTINIGVKFSVFWFMEFQERGAPHYHMFTTWIPDKKMVSRAWYETVGSEDERHLRAGTRVDVLKNGRGGTISYASKYACKQEQKRPPEGYENLGRFWGVAGCRVIVVADTTIRPENKEKCKKLMKELRNMLKLATESGEMKILKKNNDVLVAICNNRKIMSNIRKQVFMIECKCMWYSKLFEDAELSINY
jgi:hypothetical protein